MNVALALIAHSCAGISATSAHRQANVLRPSALWRPWATCSATEPASVTTPADESLPAAPGRRCGAAAPAPLLECLGGVQVVTECGLAPDPKTIVSRIGQSSAMRPVPLSLFGLLDELVDALPGDASAHPLPILFGQVGSRIPVLQALRANQHRACVSAREFHGCWVSTWCPPVTAAPPGTG